MNGPSRIVCLTEETTEWLYLLGEERRIVGISGATPAYRSMKSDLERPAPLRSTCTPVRATFSFRSAMIWSIASKYTAPWNTENVRCLASLWSFFRSQPPARCHKRPVRSSAWPAGKRSPRWRRRFLTASSSMAGSDIHDGRLARDGCRCLVGHGGSSCHAGLYCVGAGQHLPRTTTAHGTGASVIEQREPKGAQNALCALSKGSN